jgi:hypothetical protein
MPRVRRRSKNKDDKNKKFIYEKDIKAEVIRAIFDVIPDEVVERMWEGVEEADNPLDSSVVSKVARTIQKRLDEIVESIVFGLANYLRGKDRWKHLYYREQISETEFREIGFDASVLRGLVSEIEDEEEKSLNRAKDFLREILGRNDLAEAFAYVFIEFATTSPMERYERFTPEYEKEEGERRAEEWKKKLEEEEEEKRQWEFKFEEEPSESELKDVEKLGEDEIEGSDVGWFPEEDILSEDMIGDEFDEIFPEYDDFDVFYDDEGEIEDEEDDVDSDDDED